MKYLLVLLFLGSNSFSQNTTLKELTFNEYLGFVKKYHPLVKTASLGINAAQANLLLVRGGFDPKIEVDYDKKQFKNNEYYSLLNSSFKIPTWYGIEVKASFNNNEGIFINPENIMPSKGLTSVGINIPLGQGLLINKRMSDLRNAKIQIKLSQAERNLNAISVLYDAAVAYFNWKQYYSEVKLYENYLKNAQTRFDGVSSLIENGDKPAIDSVEAKIVVRNRMLSLEESKLKLTKSKLELANFLWLENNIPMELQEEIMPEENLEFTIQETLKTNELLQANPSIENHPKINALQNKIDILNVERKLKANLLLPKIDIGYHYLSEPSYWNETNFTNYKIGLNFYFPIFLRKERGNLQISKLKIIENQFGLNLEKLQLENKIKAQQTEINSLEKQRKLIAALVNDNNVMVLSEERLFSFGESSIFLINSRENNLLGIQLSKIRLENSYLNSNAALFKIMANPD